MTSFEDLVDVQQQLTDSREIKELVGCPLVEHRIRIPGLLEQLYLAATDPTMQAEEGGNRLKPRSKPPLAVEAWSRYQDINKAALRWVRSVRVEENIDPARNVRMLVTAAAGHRGYLAWDDETMEALISEMWQWRRWCAVLTGWESLPTRPWIRCPDCGQISSIWVNTAEVAAYCSACGGAWDDAYELGEKVAV